VSDTVINFQGLTLVQVAQNQAAIVSDPQNHIFVLKNSGFVAYGAIGSYDVLAIVDQTHLPNVIKDRVTGAVLGRSLEVRMSSNTGLVNSATKDYVVALLYVPSGSVPEDVLLMRSGTRRVLAWTFPRIIARSCSLGMTSSYFPLGSTVSPIRT